MCCFSGPVEEVKNTRIFARMGEQGNQVLIYQMGLKVAQEVAMVLPIPVKPKSAEDAVRFFSFAGYQDVFSDLWKAFPIPESRGPGPFGAVPAAAAAPTLQVVSVGAYDASFVPAIADFARLDERFRLPEQVWDQLPGYKDFGFAVFKLKPGEFEAHPMAFAFPTARPENLFFPTLHIHDGKVHGKESFDHTLYCQATRQNLARWEESPRPAVSNVKCGLTHGMIRPELHLYRQEIRGVQVNGDIVVKPRLG